MTFVTLVIGIFVGKVTFVYVFVGVLVGNVTFVLFFEKKPVTFANMNSNIPVISNFVGGQEILV